MVMQILFAFCRHEVFLSRWSLCSFKVYLSYFIINLEIESSKICIICTVLATKRYEVKKQRPTKVSMVALWWTNIKHAPIFNIFYTCCLRNDLSSNLRNKILGIQKLQHYEVLSDRWIAQAWSIDAKIQWRCDKY
jgi:hypothetical protein